MSVVDTIKARPILFGSVAVGGVILIVLLRASSGGSMQPTVPAGDVGSGDALQNAMIQANHDISLAQISASAHAADTAASLEAAKLDYEYKNNAAAIGENVALTQINATLQALTNRDTLSAQVEMGAQKSDVEKTALTTGAQTEQFKTLANALVSQSQSQAAVAMASIQANKPKGLLSSIFS